jgi:hypothetical protein
MFSLFPDCLRFGALNSLRSRYHLKVAIALVVVIPMLSFCLIAISLFSPTASYSLVTQVGVTVMGLVCGLSGYGMLKQYPANLERLRGYLERIAHEDIPDHATLLHAEQDISDIERYLNVVISGLHDKIFQLDKQLGLSRQMVSTIEKQSDEIVAAEQQRVMIESLGAACHHLGQPAMVLSLYLSRVQDLRPEVLNQDDFVACAKAVEDIGTILKKLTRVSEYRSVPYITFADGLKGATETTIVDIEPGEGDRV